MRRTADLFAQAIGRPDHVRLEAMAGAAAVLLAVAAGAGAWPLLTHRPAAPAPTARAAAAPSPTPAPIAPPVAAPPPVAPLPPPVLPPPAAGVAAGPPPATELVAAPPPPAATAPPPAPASAAAPAAVPAAAAAPACGGSGSPGGTVTVRWAANRVTVTFGLTGLAPRCSYAVGLFSTTCQSHGSLLSAFPALTATAGGTDAQTVTGAASLGSVPAHASIRVGPPGTTDSASAATSVACANVQDTLNSSNPSFTTHLS